MTINGGRNWEGTPESGRPVAAPTARADHDSGFKLRHRTVSQPNGPDRWTVFPPGMEGVPRMSTWLTVDASCVVDLENAR